LRTRIDAVFLPRPIHFVDRIPRNDTGKLTQASLHAMIARLAPIERGAQDAARR
jgi:acyl-coenzyme A synthetase/AMP-(fatty) acid ligase